MSRKATVPGGAYRKNFNKSPRGRFKVSMKRGQGSRSKSARG